MVLYGAHADTIRAAARRTVATLPLPVPPAVPTYPTLPVGCLTAADKEAIDAFELLVAFALVRNLTPGVCPRRLALAKRRLATKYAPPKTTVIQEWGWQRPGQRVFDVVVATGPARGDWQVVDSLPVAVVGAQPRRRYVVRPVHQRIAKLVNSGKAKVVEVERPMGPHRPRRTVIADRKRGLAFETQQAMFGEAVVGPAEGQEGQIEKQFTVEDQQGPADLNVEHILDESFDSLGDEGLCRCKMPPAKCVCGDPLYQEAVEDTPYAGFANDDQHQENLRERAQRTYRRYVAARAQYAEATDPVLWTRQSWATMRRLAAEWRALRLAAYDLQGVDLEINQEKREALLKREAALGRELEAPFTITNFRAERAYLDMHRAWGELDALCDDLTLEEEVRFALPARPFPAVSGTPQRDALVAYRDALRRERDKRAAAGVPCAKQARSIVRLTAHIAALDAPMATPDVRWARDYHRAMLAAEIAILRAAGEDLRARLLARQGTEG